MNPPATGKFDDAMGYYLRPIDRRIVLLKPPEKQAERK
jgi:hypothetical protein